MSYSVFKETRGFVVEKLYGFIRHFDLRMKTWHVAWAKLDENTFTLASDEYCEVVYEKEIISVDHSIESYSGEEDELHYGFVIHRPGRNPIILEAYDFNGLELWMMTLINRSNGPFRQSEDFFLESPSFVSSQNSNEASVAHTSLEGYLLKKGFIVKNWKKRFFVLQDGTLNYYDDNPNLVTFRRLLRILDKARPLNSLVINQHTIVVTVPEELAGKPHAISIFVNNSEEHPSRFVDARPNFLRPLSNRIFLPLTISNKSGRQDSNEPGFGISSSNFSPDRTRSKSVDDTIFRLAPRPTPLPHASRSGCRALHVAAESEEEKNNWIQAIESWISFAKNPTSSSSSMSAQ